VATTQSGRNSDDKRKPTKTTKTNFATKGLMPESVEGTARSRRGGGIGGTVAELRNVFGKKK
jgi:hypothetical protein